MKTILKGTFQRLLKKIDTSFDDLLVKAEFDNGIMTLEAEKNYSTQEVNIVLWDDEENVKLSESQENTILLIMEGCYNSNIQQWKEDNKRQLKEDFNCDRADERRKDY